MDNKNNTQNNDQNGLNKPDPETLHTTDPQEHMEGPVSSLVQDVRKIAESKQKVEAPAEKTKTDLPEAADDDEDEDENHYNNSLEKE